MTSNRWIEDVQRRLGAHRALGVAAVAGAGLLALGAGGVQEAMRIDAQERREEAAAAEQRAAAVEHAAFTRGLAARQAAELEVARGETLAGLLARAGAPLEEISPALAVIDQVFNARRLRPGDVVKVFFEAPAPEGEARLTGLAFRSQPGAAVTVSRRRDGGFIAREIEAPVTFDVARLSAQVNGSIYESALAAGATDREVAGLADAFAFAVDFQREVRPGDPFELVFERYVDEEGNTIRTGELLYAAMSTPKGYKSYYRFQAPGEQRLDWYDAQGVSSRRFLMRTPVNGARLSSGFGLRRHPILGYSRLHQGADFAAGHGTPIMAAGDGVVVRAGTYGGYGNYIRIRHADGYETAYAHLSRYARGLRAGARVRQGEVIGFVGSTGRSTGPHLHYEVLHRGRHVNPLKLKVATGRTLSGEALSAFQAEKDRIDTLRNGSEGGATVLVASAAQQPLN